MKIKQVPSDFIVIEVPKEYGPGEYTHVELKKESLTTQRAIENIAQVLHVPAKYIGFCGNKDKDAITTQQIAIKGVSDERINAVSIQNISLKVLDHNRQQLGLGDLKENKFEITLRDLSMQKAQKIIDKAQQTLHTPNYFGPQRFSENNVDRGLAIIKRDFKKVCEYLIESDDEYKQRIIEHLNLAPHDYVNALKTIPKIVLKIYISALQSQIFNDVLRESIKKNTATKELPIIGFGSEINDESEELIDNELEKYGISQRDFIVRELPHLSAEGTMRECFVDVNIKYSEIQDDELNKDKKKLVLKFSLPPSSYATTLITFLDE